MVTTYISETKSFPPRPSILEKTQRCRRTASSDEGRFARFASSCLRPDDGHAIRVSAPTKELRSKVSRLLDFWTLLESSQKYKALVTWLSRLLWKSPLDTGSRRVEVADLGARGQRQRLFFLGHFRTFSKKNEWGLGKKSARNLAFLRFPETKARAGRRSLFERRRAAAALCRRWRRPRPCWRASDC